MSVILVNVLLSGHARCLGLLGVILLVISVVITTIRLLGIWVELLFCWVLCSSSLGWGSSSSVAVPIRITVLVTCVECWFVLMLLRLRILKHGVSLWLFSPLRFAFFRLTRFPIVIPVVANERVIVPRRFWRTIVVSIKVGVFGSSALHLASYKVNNHSFCLLGIRILPTNLNHSDAISRMVLMIIICFLRHKNFGCCLRRNVFQCITLLSDNKPNVFVQHLYKPLWVCKRVGLANMDLRLIDPPMLRNDCFNRFLCKQVLFV
jgi:hypothetical protein